MLLHLLQHNSSIRSLANLSALLIGNGSSSAAGVLGHRHYAAATAEDLAAARATRPGQPAPLLLPFAVTLQQALAAFTNYQRDSCFRLHASNLLTSEHKLQPLFMPFWLFEATVSTEAIAALGRKADPSAGSKAPLVWTQMTEWRPISSHLTVPRSERCMQVYAAYSLRRDLSEAAKPAALDPAAAHSLSIEDLQQQQYPDPVPGTAAASSSSNSSGSSGSSSSSRSSSNAGQVPLELPLMRQAIAWQLCHRELMHQQIHRAADLLKRELKADDVRDLRVRMRVHSRSARLGYFPAYHLQYVHGEKYTPSRADIVPARYDALIGAADKQQPRVSAELHPSPLKSQAAAAAGVAGLGLGVMPLTSLALGIDPGFISLAGADAALAAVLAATGAGALAAQLPLIARNRHAAAQAEADRKFYKQYDQRQAGFGTPDQHTLWLWRDADWRRWERDDAWDWNAEGRRAQAEDLFRQQAQRDVDRIMAAKQQEELNRKREEDEAREAKKESKFGRHRRFAHGGHEEAGTRTTGQRHGAPKRKRDFLGYYKALGINLEDAGAAGPISGDFIKVHYKAAALKLHPDKHVHADAATQQRTAERFRRLQVAYEVLKDAEKRRAYDQGRLVH